MRRRAAAGLSKDHVKTPLRSFRVPQVHVVIVTLTEMASKHKEHEPKEQKNETVNQTSQKSFHSVEKSI